ncbi:MAG TPA: hypothetical protein VHM88_12670, partial [Candidatus Acidoferrales bacterium]|nr:hypothetical protein [Candidatus Acidoferrales bacterium]
RWTEPVYEMRRIGARAAKKSFARAAHATRAATRLGGKPGAQTQAARGGLPTAECPSAAARHKQPCSKMIDTIASL